MDNIPLMLNSIQPDIFDFFEDKLVMDAFSTLITLIIAVTIFFIIYSLIRQVSLKMVKTREQVSHVHLFLSIVKYIFGVFILLIVISAYFGTWIELGITAGLLTAAVGWALQKPITGMAAWVMIAVRRPFGLGDRVMIKGIKGDIIDITLTHIYLAEIGGTIGGEEQSGRIAMIPNALLFEIEIINYTKQHQFILDEIIITITYESNLKKAEQMMIDSVAKIMDTIRPAFPKKIPKDAHTRLKFGESGIELTVRYYTPAKKRSSVATEIRREIYTRIRKAKDIRFAYPHTEVLLKSK